jgi:hypothetical protein
MLWHPLFSFTSNAAPAPPVVVETYSGGFAHLPTGRVRTRAEIAEARRRFGILPAKVQKVIARVVTDQADEPESKWLTALHAALERKNIAYRALYAEVLRDEFMAQAQAQRDDEDVLAMILLMH